MSFRHIEIPAGGERIVVEGPGRLRVPDQPVIAYLEGDGIGADIGPVMQRAVDAAVARTYGGARRIHWMEVFAGAKAASRYEGEWYPAETLDAISEFAVAIQGPLAMPIGGGFRSLNVALRHEFDLYAAVSAVRALPGVRAPLRDPSGIDVVMFRETAEDAYSAIEWRAGSRQAERMIAFLQDEMGVKKLRFTERCAIGIKPVSEEGCKRLVRRALQFALDHDCKVVTLVHKGNVMRHTEGAFQRWGYEVATAEFGAEPEADGMPGLRLINEHTGSIVRIGDIVADVAVAQLLERPDQFEVIATLNVNGDLLADTLTALIGTTGVTPCASLGDGIALFEVTHGPAEPLAGQDCGNPLGMLLAAEMLLRHIGWCEAADLLAKSLGRMLMASDALVADDPQRLSIPLSVFADRLLADIAQASDVADFSAHSQD